MWGVLIRLNIQNRQQVMFHLQGVVVKPWFRTLIAGLDRNVNQQIFITYSSSLGGVRIPALLPLGLALRHTLANRM